MRSILTFILLRSWHYPKWSARKMFALFIENLTVSLERPFLYVLLHYMSMLGLPWWRSGWGSVCQCRERGFGPWSGRIPHAAERLGPCARLLSLRSGAREPQLLRPVCREPVLRGGGGHRSEGPAHCSKEWPPFATTGESPCAAARTQHGQKENK